MPELLSLISERVVVVDGAMGTRLQSLTGNAHSCIDGFNLDPTFSEIVQLVHRSYIEAGADVIFTNTYGANAFKLQRYGRKSQTVAINFEGARLARRVAGTDTLVGGSVGPLEVYAFRDEVSEEELTRVFGEQIAALVEGGVHFLALETFQDPVESTCALRAASEFGLPIVFSIGGVHNGRTGTGAEAQDIALIAADMGAAVIGANCRGPFDILETVRLLAQVTSLPLLAMPNAGSPEIDRGRVAYHVEPQQLRTYTRRLVEAGAVMVGGCCGTGPEHIREIAGKASKLHLPPTRAVSRVRVVAASPKASHHTEYQTNHVAQVFKSVKTIVSVEMRPVRAGAFEDYLEAGRLLAREGVHLFDVPDNAGAKVTLDPMVSAARLQSETRIPTIMHLSTSHRNLIATQSYLLGCWESGIQAILAVTGDHPNVGDHDKYANRVNDVKSSVNLMKLIGDLNQGKLFNGTPCLETGFLAGGGFNPMRNLTPQLKWLKRKLDAGAQFIYTQPLYTEEDVDRLLEATAEFGVPVLLGVLPLTSRRNAEFFAAGKIPGIIVPPHIVDAFEKVESREDGIRLGMDIACQFLSRIKDRIRGCYIIPPFAEEKYNLVVDLLRHTGMVEAHEVAAETR
ncbi:MAG: bifunctional homocysteine S-methyltransferase/methylenetetrahydrofolate reductase [Candidatus Eremiobacteraeota bacterium]|nr:bifunctional homocysteine S-methyltransferase/methylenetetrahydrofolate reductase [Candidatus Eremiobacteraeota bacterium]